MIIKFSKKEIEDILIKRVKEIMTVGDNPITCSLNVSSYNHEAAEVTIEEKKVEEKKVEEKTDIPF